MPRKKAKTETYDDLVRQLRKLAKRADQRMVRLEKAEGQRGFEHITSFSYSKAEAEIERFSGQLKEGQKVMVQYEIKVTQVKAKTDGSVFYKNNIKITNLNTF